MPMTLLQAIKANFPSANLRPIRGNVELTDEGNGPFVSRWDEQAVGAPVPSKKDLAVLMAGVAPVEVVVLSIEDRVAALEKKGIVNVSPVETPPVV